MSAVEQPAPRTPVTLWIVGVLALFFAIYGVVDYLATIFRYEPYLNNYSDEMLAYFFGLPIWPYIIWGIGNAGSLLGAAFLLRRNRFATPMLALGFLSAVFSFFAPMIWPPPEEVGGAASAAGILGFSFAVTAYAWWLTRRGVLR